MKRVSEVKASNTKSIAVTVAAGICFVFILGTLFTLNNNKEKTIQVVKVKSDIYPNGLITESNLEAYNMPLTEFNNNKGKGEYLTWADVDECKNKYSTVYTKKYICKDDYTPTRPIKNEWLTEAEEGTIFIPIPYDRIKNFGNILTPGDYIKVAVSYQSNTTGTDALGYQTVEGENVDEVLFDKIQVVDMLNAKGNSIYDYYTDLLSLDVKEREEQLRDDKFLDNVSPTEILLKVDAKKDFETFMKVTKYSSLKYTFGLYPRIEDDTILSQFRDLTRQITAAQTQVTNDNTNKKGGAN